MKTEIVAKETIKPCSPTPKSFNLIIMDQVSPPVYTKLYSFYQNTSTDDISDVITKTTQTLKSSLSEVLTRFYPFVGRIRDQQSVTIEEDDGAEFVEARVDDATLSDYLEKPTPEMFLHLVPNDFWELGTRRPLLSVQASFFKCGGLAIGMNFSHKISDAATFASFINAWAHTAIGNYDKVDNPDFSGSLLIPSLPQIFLSGEDMGETVTINDKTKSFVFRAEQLAALQKTATNGNIPWASRMETVTTFIWRIGMKTSNKRKGSCSSSPSVLLTPVNIRRKLPPPICDQTFGNLVETQLVENESGEIELPHLIGLLREKIKASREDYEKNFDREHFMEKFMMIGEKMMGLISQPEVFNAFTISSWNKFPLYETDFGFGKPIWVATHNPMPYVIILIDTRDGTGIEAWVNLPEEQMAIFANDEELLTYATMDPSAL